MYVYTVYIYIYVYCFASYIYYIFIIPAYFIINQYLSPSCDIVSMNSPLWIRHKSPLLFSMGKSTIYFYGHVRFLYVYQRVFQLLTMIHPH